LDTGLRRHDKILEFRKIVERHSAGVSRQKWLEMRASA